MAGYQEILDAIAQLRKLIESLDETKSDQATQAAEARKQIRALKKARNKILEDAIDDASQRYRDATTKLNEGISEIEGAIGNIERVAEVIAKIAEGVALVSRVAGL